MTADLRAPDEAAVLESLAAARILPVVAIEEPSIVGELCSSLLDGGITCIEITFRTSAAAAALREAVRVEGMLVGAGTVLTVEQA